MSSLPRVRWLALLLAVAFGLVWAGVGYDLAAAIGHLGTKAAGLATALLAAARMIRAAMTIIDEDDPMVYTQDGRDVEEGSFWGRVW